MQPSNHPVIHPSIHPSFQPPNNIQHHPGPSVRLSCAPSRRPAKVLSIRTRFYVHIKCISFFFLIFALLLSFFLFSLYPNWIRKFRRNCNGQNLIVQNSRENAINLYNTQFNCMYKISYYIIVAVLEKSEYIMCTKRSFLRFMRKLLGFSIHGCFTNF